MKKQYIFALLSLFFIHTSAYTQKNLNKGKALDKEYYTEIAFEYLKGKIIIPVVIEGVTYRFLLDTGAPNLITSKLKNSIKTRALKTNIVRDANNKKRTMKVVSIPRLTLGEITFKNIPNLVYELDENIIFDCFDIDGFIGSNLLRNSVLHINLDKKIIAITNKIDTIDAKFDDGIPMTLVGNQKSPYIPIQLKGHKTAKESLLFDTGMPDLYDLSIKTYKKIKPHHILNNVSSGVGTSSISLFGNANNNKHLRGFIPEFHVANMTFKNVATQTTVDNHSRVGTGLLAHGDVTLNFEGKRFYFHPKGKNTVVDVNEKLFGISTTMIKNKIAVGIVWDNTLKGKIKSGDQILSINNIDYTKIPYCNFVTKPSIFKDTDTLHIVYKNKEGLAKELTLIKE